MDVKPKQKSGGFFKKNAIFKQFTPVQIEHIMIKVRIMINEERKRIDGQLKYYVKLLYSNQNITEQYLNLQQICLRLLEIKANKIILQYAQKVMENRNTIAEADGSVYNIKQQAKWIQIIAWYLQIKRLNNKDQFLNFCLEFFKGVDVLQDPKLQTVMSEEIKGCKSKLNEIRFALVKDWLDMVIEEFPKNVLAQHLQLNELFLSNNFTNIQIKEYFSNQLYQQPSMHATKSNLIPYNDPNDSKEQPNFGVQNKFNDNFLKPRNSSSEVKEQKPGEHMTHTRDSSTEISVEEKYSLLIIKQCLKNYSLAEKEVIIKVPPIDK